MSLFLTPRPLMPVPYSVTSLVEVNIIGRYLRIAASECTQFSFLNVTSLRDSLYGADARGGQKEDGAS